MGVGIIVWVCVGAIAQVRKAVCGWGCLDCCHKVYVCVWGGGGGGGGGEGGVCV